MGSPTAITTVGDAAYVRDLEEWLGRVPPNTAKFSAIMRHEQEHSRRQIDYGTSLWVARYAVDKDFALREEKIGYYYEITEKRRFGLVVDPNIYAAVLSNYEILTGKLIGFNEAFLWVNDVIEGRWTPED